MEFVVFWELDDDNGAPPLTPTEVEGKEYRP